MTILLILLAWFAVSALAGVAFGRIVRGLR